MPKLKDLGVKVLPDTMRPPEIGGGGPLTDGCTLNTQCAGTFGMSDLCGVAAAAAICPAFTGCTWNYSRAPEVGPGAFMPCVAAPTHGCGCTLTQTVVNLEAHYCLCTHHVTNLCVAGSGCGGYSMVCAASMIPARDPFTREAIGALKDQLKQQLEALEAVEKNLGPKTAEAIDGRLKELEDELAQLKQRRRDLK